MNDFSKKIEASIAKNKAIIAEAKETIAKMKAFFKSQGADLDSGRNIFLESKQLSPESRKHAEEMIRKVEQELAARHQAYEDKKMALPEDSIIRKILQSNPTPTPLHTSKPKKVIHKFRI